MSGETIWREVKGVSVEEFLEKNGRRRERIWNKSKFQDEVNSTGIFSWKLKDFILKFAEDSKKEELIEKLDEEKDKIVKKIKRFLRKQIRSIKKARFEFDDENDMIIFIVEDI